jgi:hypothetical protein
MSDISTVSGDLDQKNTKSRAKIKNDKVPSVPVNIESLNNIG